MYFLKNIRVTCSILEMAREISTPGHLYILFHMAIGPE